MASPLGLSSKGGTSYMKAGAPRNAKQKLLGLKLGQRFFHSILLVKASFRFSTEKTSYKGVSTISHDLFWHFSVMECEVHFVGLSPGLTSLNPKLQKHSFDSAKCTDGKKRRSHISIDDDPLRIN